jgi:Family of unknown function (DUF6404)
LSNNLHRFEQLAYLGLAVAVVQAPFEIMRAMEAVVASPSASAAAKAVAIAGEVLGILMGWLPIWLIARRRWKWARWLFLAIYAAALLFSVTNIGRAGPFFDFMNVLQAVLWGTALFFLFTARPENWLRDTPDERPVTTQAGRTRMRIPGGRRVVVAPGELSYRGRIDAHIREMTGAGMARAIVAPPQFQLLWAMGVDVAPPLFLAFVPNMTIMAVPLVVVWSILVPFAPWSDPLSTYAAGIFLCLFAGALVAAYYRDKSYTLALPSWDNYLPSR